MVEGTLEDGMNAGTHGETNTNDGVADAVRRVTVQSPSGLHARPASVLAARAQTFVCDLSLVLVASSGERSVEVGTRIDAKSVLDVIVLGAGQGTVLDIEAVGPDAEDAVSALAELFATGFGLGP